MIRLRVAIRAFSDFEAALGAQLGAYRAIAPSVEVTPVPLGLREMERAILGEEELRRGGLDLAILPTDWMGRAVDSGSLEALEPWMAREALPGWPDGWPESLTGPIRRKDGVYCIPWHDGPECLIYRRDLFEDEDERRPFRLLYDRELRPPQTWAEFERVARFFTRPEQGLFGTVFAAFPDGHNTLYDFVLQVWSRGGELYDRDGRPALASAEATAGLDFYRKIVRDARACYPGGGGLDSVMSGEVFFPGQVAMMVNWFGFAARCERADSGLRGRIGLAAIPGGRLGQTASLSNYWVVGIGSGCGEKAAAYDLLRHLASEEADRLTSLHGAVGVRLSTWRDTEVLERYPVYSELERLSATARTLPFCEDLPRLAEIVDRVTIAALGTDEASEGILERAQAEALALGLRLA